MWPEVGANGSLGVPRGSTTSVEEEWMSGPGRQGRVYVCCMTLPHDIGTGRLNERVSCSVAAKGA